MNTREMAEELFNCMIITQRRPFAKEVEEISQGEMAVLEYLMKVNNQVPAGELSLAFHISTARIAALLKTLERKKLVTREIANDDRRKIIVSITDYGKKNAEEKYQKAIDGISALINDLGEVDAMELLRIQKKIVGLIKKKEAEEHSLCIRN